MPTPEYLPFQKGQAGAQGHIVREQIQVFDIMPTALELAGITPNRTHFATSLVPQLMGAKGDPDRVVYSDGGFLYPTEIEPMAGDCDLKDDVYGHRGLEEICELADLACCCVPAFMLVLAETARCEPDGSELHGREPVCAWEQARRLQRIALG
jgi:hypothetical protein